MDITARSAKRRKTTPHAGHRPTTRSSLARTQQNDASLPAYLYQTLEKPDEIRIFKVESTGPTEWQYDIEHTTLAKAPPFETVSYVWGPDTRRNILRLRSNQTIRINDNLANALPFLSAECKTGYLWIDQINIDQSSTQERNHQVKMMGNIYRKGERVLAWLGAGQKPSKRILALIEEVRFSLELRETVSLTKAKIENHVRRCCSKDLVAIRSMLESEWFSRAWVFQEIALSKHATFLSGAVNLPFLALVWISKVFANSKVPKPVEYCYTSCSGPVHGSPRSVLNTNIISTRGYRTLSAMHQSWYAILHDMNVHRTPFIWTLSKISPLLQTTDCRDSVYAFLGLQTLKCGDVPIEADYDSTYEETLINTAISIVRNTKTLDILAYCGREGSNENLSRRLPSWVPEWKASVSAPLLVFNTVRSFSWNINLHTFVCTPDASELPVRGMRLDTINTCFTPEFRFRSASWYDESLEEYLALDTRRNHVGKRRNCSRWRLLDLLLTRPYRPDVEYNHYPGNIQDYTTSTLLFTYDEHVEAYKKDRTVEESQSLHVLRHQTYLVNRRQLFLTEGGHLGYVKNPSPGDIICILKGITRLVVLRPCRSGRFNVVGICHAEVQLWDPRDNYLSMKQYVASLRNDREEEDFVLV